MCVVCFGSGTGEMRLCAINGDYLTEPIHARASRRALMYAVVLAWWDDTVAQLGVVSAVLADRGARYRDRSHCHNDREAEQPNACCQRSRH